MSATNEPVSTRYATQERLCAPLRTAVDLIESLVTTSGIDAVGHSVLTEARTALARLDALVPSFKDVLSEFLESCGAIDSKFDRAQNYAWRHGSNDPEITDNLCTETLKQINEFFTAVSPSARHAEAAYQHVAAETWLLRSALDEAQADGWSRGDSCSSVREKLVERFMHIISTAALGITTNQDKP